MKNYLLISCFIFGFIACVKYQDLPNQGFDAKPILPDLYYNYADQDVSELFHKNGSIGELIFADSVGLKSSDMGVTDAGATLGRVLFYDKRLSVNNTVSCGTCHKQVFAFSDQTALSTGFEGRITTRNARSIINPGAVRNLFWDSRTDDLKDMVLLPIQNHVEMGFETFESLTTKISNTDFYPELFKKAFGSNNTVSEFRIANALTQFLSSMITLDSKFDRGRISGFSNYTPLEHLGKELFESERTNCSQCHTGINLTDSFESSGEYGGSSSNKGGANIGLDKQYSDNGIQDGKFNIPSLRNVELTAPYMHDGRFASLEEVIEHYNNNIQPHFFLDNHLKTDNLPRRMNLNEIEVTALAAFLRTLTDHTFINDPKFSDPFQQ